MAHTAGAENAKRTWFSCFLGAAVAIVFVTLPLVRATAGGSASKDEEESWILPRSGYAERLKNVAYDSKESGGLRVEVTVIPDAYRYAMALGMEELEEADYAQEKLGAKLRALHKKHKSDRGKALFLVHLRGTGAKNHYFLTSTLKKHLALHQGKPKTFRLRAVSPKPRYRAWRIFEYVPDAPRRISRKKLSSFKSLRLEFISTTLKPHKEPFTLTVKGLLRVPHTGGVVSVNSAIHQISCFVLSRLGMSPIEVKFYPRRWRIPEAPEEFEEILKRLGKSASSSASPGPR